MEIPFEQALDWLCAKTVTYLPEFGRRYEVRLWCRPDPDKPGYPIGDVKGAVEANLPEKKQQREYDKLYTKIEDVMLKHRSKGIISFSGVINSDKKEGEQWFQVSINYDEGKKVQCHFHSCGMLLEEGLTT